LGAFFAPRKRAGLVQKAHGRPGALRARTGCCRSCGEEFEVARELQALSLAESSAGECTGEELPSRALDLLCRACHGHELAWARVRCWVCLHALVAERRAFPLCEAAEGLDPCTSWDEDGAAERALLASTAGQGSGSRRAPSGLGRVAASLVRLPADLLARVLEFAHAGAGEVFAPPRAQPPAPMPQASYRRERKQHHCCQFLLAQGSCLHGRVVPRGPRGGCRKLACWYCPRTFPVDGGVPELQAHADAEHAADIATWLRKKRKVKARQQREWYQSSRLGEARRMMDYERATGRGMQARR